MDGFIVAKKALLHILGTYDYWYGDAPPTGDGWEKSDNQDAKYTYRRKRENGKDKEKDGEGNGGRSDVGKTDENAGGANQGNGNPGCGQGREEPHFDEGHNVLRDIQDAGLYLPDKVCTLYHTGGKELDEDTRKRLSGTLGRHIKSAHDGRRHEHQLCVNPKNGEKVGLNAGCDKRLFHDVFEVARQHLKFGDCVTLHDEEEYANNDNYLTDDGLSGFSITPDGDLVSVFSIGRGGFIGTIAPIIKEKGITCDCFASPTQNLPNLYESKFGFKTIATVEYNRDVLVEEHGEEYADYFEKVYGKSPVHLMANPKFLDNPNIEPLHCGKDDWDKAFEYREKCLKRPKQTKKASIIAMRIMARQGIFNGSIYRIVK